MPRLFSYVLREDTGFAPNPYRGFCTLACCKPRIRDKAQKGDWIIGTGSNAKGNDRGGYISYVMRVTDVLTFDEYWHDDRYIAKSPTLTATLQNPAVTTSISMAWMAIGAKFQRTTVISAN